MSLTNYVLAVAALGAVYVLWLAVRYFAAVRSIKDPPGLRLVLSPLHVSFIGVFMPAIPGVKLPRGWYFDVKHKSVVQFMKIVGGISLVWLLRTPAGSLTPFRQVLSRFYRRFRKPGVPEPY